MQEVCFGHVRANVIAHHTPKPPADARHMIPNNWPLIKCKLVRDTLTDVIIRVLDPHGFEFGQIDFGFASVLVPAMDHLEKLRLQARLMNRRIKPNECPHQPCSETLTLSLNIYGLKKDALRIRKLFSQRNIWFQPPMASEPGYPWENPQLDRRNAVQRP